MQFSSVYSKRVYQSWMKAYAGDPVMKAKIDSAFAKNAKSDGRPELSNDEALDADSLMRETVGKDIFNAIVSKNGGWAATQIQNVSNDNEIMDTVVRLWSQARSKTPIDPKNKGDIAIIQWLMGLRGKDITGVLDSKTKAQVSSLRGQLSAKNPSINRNSFSQKCRNFAAVCMVGCVALAADDATGVGVLDDPLILVGGFLAGAAWLTSILCSADELRKALASIATSLTAQYTINQASKAKTQLGKKIREKAPKGSDVEFGKGGKHPKVKVRFPDGTEKTAPYPDHGPIKQGTMGNILKQLGL